jgi:hypothetical protein
MADSLDKPETAEPEKKRQLLQATYHAMPAAKIRRRLASGELTPLAAEIAKQELLSRNGKEPEAVLAMEMEKAREEEIAADNIDGVSPRAYMLLSLLLGLPGIGILYLMHSDYLPLAVFIQVAFLGGFLGKLHPRIGLLLGALLAGSPLYVIVAWYLKPPRNGIETVIAGLVLFFSIFPTAVGANMIYGARYQGSWKEFVLEIESRRRAAVDEARK